jgi:hypothetical protein
MAGIFVHVCLQVRAKEKKLKADRKMPGVFGRIILRLPSS